MAKFISIPQTFPSKPDGLNMILLNTEYIIAVYPSYLGQDHVQTEMQLSLPTPFDDGTIYTSMPFSEVSNLIFELTSSKQMPNLDHLKGQWLPKGYLDKLVKQVELNQRADRDIDLSTKWSEASKHEVAENIRKMIRHEGGEKDE